ncbi:MAG TPA: DUF3574 domain-containing protein [Caulobacteraceae bacterium]|nr:DUF3574 domain-containing protein [Caulobacteraceae bacterium]
MAVGAICALGLAACVSPLPKLAVSRQQPCPNGGYRETAELVFSRVASDGHGGVSEAEFAKFVVGEVSPRFPQGMTVIDAQGRWAPPPGSMIRTPAKMVVIVLPGTPDDSKKLEAVRVAYKTRFHQPSALLLTHGDCVSF